MGSGCIHPSFLDINTGWRSVVSFTPRSLHPRDPLERRLGGTQNRSGRRGEKKILALPGLEFRPLGHPAHSQSLYRLLYTGSRGRYKDSRNEGSKSTLAHSLRVGIQRSKIILASLCMNYTFDKTRVQRCTISQQLTYVI
jgi:hypothetical protein